VTYSDGNYIQHACVMIASLRDKIAAERDCHVYFFYSNCSSDDLRKLESTFDAYRGTNIGVELLACEFGLDKVLKAKKSYMTAAVYDKLLIYEKLPADVEKVLFLDADIVLLSDPALLYDTQLDGAILAAVRDEIFKRFSARAQETIGVSADSYFNSGVLLIDLNLWRKFAISQRSLDFCLTKGHLTELHDQDAFNHAVNGAWKPISPLWNPRSNNLIDDGSGKLTQVSRYDVYQKKLAYLVHFSGRNKPWLYMSHHPMKKIYLRYLRSTRFSDYKFPDYNTRNWFLKQIKESKRWVNRIFGKKGWI
jgi:lipopolysaccharide biosynthesis glycosyltransferase